MNKLDILSCHCQLVCVGARFCRRYFDDMCRVVGLILFKQMMCTIKIRVRTSYFIVVNLRICR